MSSGEVLSISGVKIINNIPHAVGVEAIQRVFEHYGIKKSKKAAYKFTSKVSWKKRLKTNGRSLIAVPIPEIERWIEKNYPVIWNSKKDSDEKRLIVKNFSMVEGLEKVIDEIGRRLEGKVDNSQLSDDHTIWKIEKIEGKRCEKAEVIDGTASAEDVLIKIDEFVDILLKTPPSSLDSDALSKIKDKLSSVLNFVDSICLISRCKG